VLIPILKYLSQLIMLISGILGALRAHGTLDPDTQKRGISKHGVLSIAGIVIGFILFVAIDWKDRDTNSKRNNDQQSVITELRKSLYLSRDIEGIEISFTPTDKDWVDIESAYNKIPRLVPEVSYSDATMKAERNKDDWTIDLGEVASPAGVVKFPPIKTTDPKYKAFVAIAEKACPSLWIDWGAKIETDIEPRGKRYPSEISISRAKISIILKSTDLKMKLKHLTEGLSITVRSNSQPATLRFVSLDDEVTLDQTVNMQWREEDATPPDARGQYLAQAKKYISGPHKLQVTLKN
jgi:hypothetical protein